MVELRNFFTDFYGLQRLKPETLTTPTNDEFFRKFQCQLERLIGYFKEQNNLKCVILVEQIKHWLKPFVKDLIKDNFVNEVVVMCVWQALKDYHNGAISDRRGILKKLPLKVYDNVKNNLDYIVANIPSNFFKTIDNCEDKTRSIILPNKSDVDLIFWIPMTEDDPKIDDNPNEMNFILPKMNELKKSDGRYDIYRRYHDYQAKFTEFPYQEFREIVDNGVKSNKTNDELFNDFLDVFGCELFEFVDEIIKNRTKTFIWTNDDDKNDNDGRKLVTNRNYKPIVANQMIVQSEEERNLAKVLRKIEKKQKSGNIEGTVDNSNYQSIFKRGFVGENSNDFPHVHDQLRNASVTTKFNGVNIKHPENTVKTETKDFIEFTIPGGKCSNSDRIDLIKINDLDSIGQLVFKDIKEFNRIQSEVFPIAYHTNENMLICAPTGGGKTNIALLTIVHQIKQHMDGGFIRKDDFKIVYVCPMKALATEMVMNFTKKLGPIGINVKEVTGDMQLTKKEIAETQLLVTTPEKWDVITRKGAVDSEVTSLVKLLILDEVHLLNSDRGPVIEALVARTLRQVLSSQSIIRIVALSATLPGYMDVSNFLKINPKSGLYFFDNRYRSVPLTMSFIGMKNKNDNDIMDIVCYNKLIPFIKDGKQVMIFVTSRNMTVQVAKNLITILRNNDNSNLFQFDQRKCGYNLNTKHFKNNDLEYLILNCIGIHHAGMCRNDRLEIENLFRLGILKIIVCTTTLAWGVNLPAHTVIIRGTTRYDPQKSQYVDLDMLDIQQIFGRAGRPQYDTSGHGIIITNTANMIKYMSLLVSQTPIESQFLNYLPDNLNAEIVLGTVTNLKEAMEWLTNTFLYCRIRKNPLVYGLTFTDIWDNDRLYEYLERKLYEAGVILEQAQMVRFNQELNELRPTNYGRISSFYYINYQTMKFYHDKFNRNMQEADLLLLISNSNEFKHIQVRNDELEELDRLYQEYNQYNYNLDQTSVEYKVITLIQANIAKAKIRITSLISDCEFIIQTVQRLSRALFEIAIDKNYSSQISKCLQLSQMIEQQLNFDQYPLLQFKQFELKTNLRQLHLIENYTISELKQLTSNELNNLINNRQLLQRVQYFLKLFPLINLDVIIKPITDGVIRLKLLIQPNFQWDNSIHGNVQHYYIWVDDPINDSVYHFESFILTKRLVTNNETIELIFTVPVVRPSDCSGEYAVNVVNSKYMHAETIYRIDLDKLHLLPSYTIQTKFLSVRPLPKTALHNENFEKLYNFTHFNAVQSQVFHCCYNTDNNILLGAPTGSGKTIVSEICILRQFARRPDLKVVYIAPMKALVRERVRDWTEKFEKISKKIIEVTGDITPHSSLIRMSDIIITTPEKWDGMSRNWLQKDFVKQVGLIIIDEIHLLAEERGPVLEIIVSRMNYINSIKNAKVRIVGLSTAMANAGDLANWLGIERKGLFNFSSSVRPVPLEIHLQGFSAKNYCPRMATMNRPAYQAICQYAPHSPTLIFVSSRKQTRITSYDLIKCLLSDTNPQQWLNCQQHEIDSIRHQIIDSDLSYLLCFGIGIHHAGLQENDRKIVENLFVQQKIQVLVATATLAWGVNFPAHLVIIKGTEYYDGLTKRYIDMPVTDILQMMGRAGRPQYDTSGVACVFVQENKKNFYRKFLFEPFPVESSLLNVLPEHVNAEIANSTVTCKAQLVDLICSTFFFRRLLVNPSYYQLDITDNEQIDPNNYLNDLAESVINRLNELKCVEIKTGDIHDFYQSTFLGQLSAQYYLSCNTLLYLDENLKYSTTFDDLIYNICKVDEYKLFPVRHNEDKINKNLSMDLQLKTNLPYDSPHLKVLLLVKCYLYDKKLPNQEYVVDLKTVFDQIIRIIQAMISLTTYKNWLQTTIKLIYLEQMLIQGITINQNPILILPNFTKETINLLKYQLINKQLIGNQENLTLVKVLLLSRQFRTKFNHIIYDIFDKNRGDEIVKILNRLPVLYVDFTIKQIDSSDNITYKINEIEKFIEIDSAKINTSILFEFNIRRDSNSNNFNVYSRKFNKQKEESWFFIISNDNTGELLRMQRFTMKKSKSVDVQIDTPQQRGIYWYSCYFMSDSYIGLDQKLTFRIKVVD